MSNRFSVDPEALHNAGINLEGVVNVADDICDKLFAAVADARGAGGTGTMGSQFNNGYQPSAQQGLDFLRLLRKTLDDTGAGTVKAAAVFAETSDDAEAAVQPS
ncbi:hypothetical protein [Actinokineospora inagensis]|uniref:hypothetical protein n=1 Tax=Actinokineospora inagensis TaxID=103730 RepID=UPI0004251351|nr:hypothetical protein [Actinokineospora inagensis]